MSQLSDAQVLQSREREAIHRPGLTDRKSIQTPPQPYIQLVWLTPRWPLTRRSLFTRTDSGNDEDTVSTDSSDARYIPAHLSLQTVFFVADSTVAS